MTRVAIIGAAGYVGLELSRQLSDAKFEVSAVARENGKFLLRDFGFKIVAPQDIASLGKVDVVVNLAYPTSGSPHNYPFRNIEILDQIKAITGPFTRIIHISTQAVFGYALDRPIFTGPAKMVRDFAYIEAKIELENLILRNFASHSVQIVRLGNVWGPGSGAWTVPLINKVLFGEPVGVDGVDGYCNFTDVANTASYLAFLVATDDLHGHQFHHLAEMSAYRWSTWIDKIETALQQKSVRQPNLSPDPVSLKQEVRNAFSPVLPGPLYRNLIWDRRSGSVLRSLLRRVGDQRFQSIKNRSPKTFVSGYKLGPAEKTFLHIMSCQTQFATSVLEQWQPPVSVEESWSRVEHWMSDAGYSIRRGNTC